MMTIEEAVSYLVENGLAAKIRKNGMEIIGGTEMKQDEDNDIGLIFHAFLIYPDNHHWAVVFGLAELNAKYKSITRELTLEEAVEMTINIYRNIDFSA